MNAVEWLFNCKWLVKAARRGAAFCGKAEKAGDGKMRLSPQSVHFGEKARK